MFKSIFTLILLSLSLGVFSQALYKVDNIEKEQNSTVIVEGEVLDQTSFWNPAHTMIFTSNKIKVYKIFKGSESLPDYIEVLTVGGTVGNDNVHASDLLELAKNDVGIFFCFPNATHLNSPVTGTRLYDVYASSQGFFKYHVEGNKAADPFTRFSSITNELYPLIQSLTGHDFVVKDPSFKIVTNPNTQGRTQATITSFSPTTVNSGATEDPANNVLTINGIGFGTGSSNAAVRFSDANAGGTFWTVTWNADEIISWSDTEIKLRVPTRAGTGSIIVRDAAGNETSSFGFLTVHYSILTATVSSITKQSNLMNANGSGGYTMMYSNNMTTEAKATFDRALDTWNQISGFNVAKGSSTGTSNATGDGVCVVFMDNAANGSPLSAGVLAVCYSFNLGCSPVSSTPYRKTEFDINIRSSYSSGSTSFTLGPCAPASNVIDLETVLFHELGHALNLGHIIDGAEGSGSSANPAKLMNATVANGVKRVSPDVSAYQGSLYTCTTNPSINFGSCETRGGHVQLTRTVDPKDDCPLSFPSSATPPGTQVTFDLIHATSNKYVDPAYTGVTCPPASTAITNNLYYVVRTLFDGSLSINVSDFAYVPAELGSCIPSQNVRIAIYQVDACPLAQNFPAIVACREFNGNGPLLNITGLTANTNYLMYVDGKSNTKASFKLTFNGGALPIKFEKFTGEIKGTTNLLKWVIAAYSDVNKISLERSSDGTDFVSIKNYTGNLDVNKEYIYADNNYFAGNNFYRLATYNKDGSIQYSNVVLLKRNDNIKVNTFPNPVDNKLNVTISSTEDNYGKIELKLYNSVGQLMLIKSANITGGTTTLILDAGNLAAGTYRLVVTDKNNELIESRSIQKL